MQIDELLQGQWFQFTGGSRPGTNSIRFFRTQDGGVLLELSYVFDWDTGETERFSFMLDEMEFQRLRDGFVTASYGSIEHKTDTEALRFEWKPTDRGFAFRMTGRNSARLEGPGRFDMLNFEEVACGPLRVD
jgi:hypothetical protein